MSKTGNVSAGKPKIGGAIHVAPVGTALPTTATETLNKAFTSLGYASEDGLKNSNSPETDTVNAWGGDVVLTTSSSKEDTFTFNLIEALNVDVLKTVYGSDNVSGTLTAGIHIKATNGELTAFSWVFDMVLKGGILKRIVVPSGTITEVGEISYTDSDPIGYETTIASEADDDGVTHHEYIQQKTASSS